MSIEIIREKSKQIFVNKSKLVNGKAYSKVGAEDYVYLIATHDAWRNTHAFRISNKNQMTIFNIDDLGDDQYYEIDVTISIPK